MSMAYCLILCVDVALGKSTVFAATVELCFLPAFTALSVGPCSPGFHGTPTISLKLPALQSGRSIKIWGKKEGLNQFSSQHKK